MHNAVVDTLHDFAKEAGLWASVNVVVPEFSRKRRDGTTEDGVMDLATWSTDPAHTTFIDVTVRSPLVPSFLPKAAVEDDFTNNRAAAEKHKRYPARGGIKLTPFPVESYGRIGPSAERLLDLFARAAERRDELRAMAPRAKLQRWQVLLSRVLFRAAARAILEAHGHYGRTPSGHESRAKRSRPPVATTAPPAPPQPNHGRASMGAQAHAHVRLNTCP